MIPHEYIIGTNIDSKRGIIINMLNRSIFSSTFFEDNLYFISVESKFEQLSAETFVNLSSFICEDKLVNVALLVVYHLWF